MAIENKINIFLKLFLIIYNFIKIHMDTHISNELLFPNINISISIVIAINKLKILNLFLR